MRNTGRVTSPQVTPPAWVRMDASGLIRFVSRQAELLFGYDGDDLGGQPIEVPGRTEMRREGRAPPLPGRRSLAGRPEVNDAL